MPEINRHPSIEVELGTENVTQDLDRSLEAAPTAAVAKTTGPPATKSMDILAPTMREPTPGPGSVLDKTLGITQPAGPIGHYQLLGELGRGGMGVVYAAVDTRLERKVAIKQLKAGLRSTHGRRLVREALAMAKLSHPNVISVYEIGESGGSTFIVMEFVEGMTLRKWLEFPRTQTQILATFKAAARGLLAAHQKYLVHRDFKPDNVMIGVDGRVRVLDFGLARAAVGSATGDTLDEQLDVEGMTEAGADGPRVPDWEELTRTGSLLGTPAYMSPEQLNAKLAGPASDQFSFCVALYEALYGKRPFGGQTVAALCAAVVLGKVEEEPEDAEVPEWLREVVMRGLRPQPEARFASMKALLDALLEGELAARPDEREPPEYVFIAHDSRDKRVVLRLCEGLLDHGVRPWLDMWELSPGKAWRRPSEEALAAAPAVIVCGRPEYAGALMKRVERDPSTIYVAQLEGGAVLESGELRASVELDAESWEEGVMALARLVGVDHERSNWLGREAERTGRGAELLSPYRGLEAFREEHARWMFGREKEVGSLVELIRAEQTRFLTLVGASGSGKSSLLLGGVCPQLRSGVLGDGREWSIAYLRPGARPCEALAHALVSLEPSHGAIADGLRVKTLRAELLEGEDTLRLITGRRTSGRLLLVIDQLEELFTEAGIGGEADAFEALAFVRNLLAATQELRGIDGRLWIAATLRADFVQRGLEVPELANALQVGTYFALPPMREGQIRAAVERPAARVGYRVEAGLVDELVRAAAHHSGRLPLLQHVLRELWARRDDQRRMLTLEAYGETGGLEGAIAGAAERALTGIRKELGDRGMLVTRRLMTRLVHLGRRTSEDTRRRVSLAELSGDTTLRRVLKAFVQEARVLVAAEVDGVEAVEIAHEALLREWSTLVGWLDADREALKLRQELAEDAGKHEVAHTSEYLWGRGRVEEAQRVLGASVVELNELERSFLKASERSVRRRRRLVQGVMGGLLTAAALIITGFRVQYERIEAEKAIVEHEKQTAEDERNKARAASEIADRELMKQMGQRASMLARSPGNELAALALAVEATGSGGAGPILSAPVFSGLMSSVMSLGTGLPLRGHTDKVVAVAYSPDGSKLATASFDATVRMWDARSGVLLQTLAGHGGKVRAVVFSPDGEQLATASEDETVRVWESNSGRELKKLEHAAVVYGVAFSPDGLQVASAGRDGYVRMWELGEAKQVMALAHEGGVKVKAVAWSPDGDKLASVSVDGAAKVWAVSDGTELASFGGHAAAKVHAVAWSPDGTRVVSGGEDGARLWAAATGEELAVFDNGEVVYALAFSPDGKYLASGTFDDDAGHLWEIASGGLVRSFGHAGPVLGVAFSPDGTMVVTASWDTTARSWTLASGQEAMRELTGHRQGVYAVARSLDGSRLATGSSDDTARLWDADTGAVIAELHGHAHDLSAVAFSPNGALLGTASRDGTAKLWDGRTGAFVATLNGHEARLHGLSFSPDGSQVATASADQTVRLWDVQSRALTRTFAYDSGIIDVRFSPDGEQLLAVTTVSTGHLRSAVTGEPLEFDFEGPVMAGAFSPDGTQLALATKGNAVVLWSSGSGELGRFEGHAGPVTQVSFSSDGSLLVTASEDGTARLWRVSSGEELSSLVHADEVVDVAFSTDDARVLTASGDDVARVWGRAVEPWLAWGCAMLDSRGVQLQPTSTRCASTDRASVGISEVQAQLERVDGEGRRYETLVEHGVEFVRIPAGTFLMGSSPGVGEDSERPQNEVTLDSFYMARTELTNAQYAVYLEANPDVEVPSSFKDPNVESYGHPDQPINGLNWFEAKAYCDWAGFELPTEAQWEYAARAGTTSVYWYGDEPSELDRFEWYSDNSRNRLHAVGRMGHNGFGLYDMVGNLAEWTLDAYGGYETAARVGDGLRHEPTSGTTRVMRGASWNYDGLSARSGNRFRNDPGNPSLNVGFRPRKRYP